MKKRRKSEWIVGILAVMLLCGGCGSGDDTKEPASVVEESAEQKETQTSAASGNTQESDMSADKDTPKTTAQSGGQDTSEDVQSGGDLDVVPPDAADDTWYKSGNVYVDENGHRLEVFFDDEGMLQFAVDGLSLYNAMANDYQQENNWRIYTCDDGTTVIYYPGAPAHLEISDGDYAGIYEEDDGI